MILLWRGEFTLDKDLKQGHQHMNIWTYHYQFSTLCLFLPWCRSLAFTLLPSMSLWLSSGHPAQSEWASNEVELRPETLSSPFSLSVSVLCVCVCVCVSLSLSLSRPLYIYKWIYSIHIYIYLNSASRSCWQCTSSLWHWVWLTVILCTE